MENAKSSKKPFALSAAVGILLVGLVFSLSMQGATLTVLGLGTGNNQINWVMLNVKSPSGDTVTYNITSASNTSIIVSQGSVLESVWVQGNGDYSYFPASIVAYYTARCNMTIYDPSGAIAYNYSSVPRSWVNNTAGSRWDVGFQFYPYQTLRQGSWTIEVIFYSIA